MDSLKLFNPDDRPLPQPVDPIDESARAVLCDKGLRRDTLPWKVFCHCWRRLNGQPGMVLATLGELVGVTGANSHTAVQNAIQRLIELHLVERRKRKRQGPFELWLLRPPPPDPKLWPEDDSRPNISVVSDEPNLQLKLASSTCNQNLQVKVASSDSPLTPSPCAIPNGDSLKGIKERKKKEPWGEETFEELRRSIDDRRMQLGADGKKNYVWYAVLAFVAVREGWLTAKDVADVVALPLGTRRFAKNLTAAIAAKAPDAPRTIDALAEWLREWHDVEWQEWWATEIGAIASADVRALRRHKQQQQIAEARVASESDQARLERLWAEFGPMLSALPPEQIREMLGQNLYLVSMFNRDGLESPLVRDELLDRLRPRPPPGGSH